MADEFTKRGHRLEQDTENPMIFRCRSRAIYHPRDIPRRSDEHLLAAILIYAPCTLGQLITTLRAWLGAYADDELLDQAERAAEKAINGLSAVSATPASVLPQPGQDQELN